METEKQLLIAIHNGEREALKRLYNRYSGYAMAIALRYVPAPDEVRDVMQDSFVKILTTIGQFQYRGEGTLKSWVASIVSHQAIDHLRAHSRFVTISTLNDSPDDERQDDDPDIEPLSPGRLTELIGRLPANYRIVLNLFVFEQWSHKDIARLLGVKENTSSSILTRAKRMLARMIKEEMKKE